MTIMYRVYSNRGTGGPVDYTAPIASTAGLTFTTDPLSSSSDNTFVVRTFDTATNLEDGNTEARVRVVIGADDRDLSALPREPHALSLSPAYGGGCRVTWAY